MQVFEKVAAFIFLMLLVGMVLFLVYVPIPPASEKVVLMIIGGLMTSATTALPKLFGHSNTAERLAKLETEYEVLKAAYDGLTAMLIQRHVVDGDGNGIPRRLPKPDNETD